MLKDRPETPTTLPLDKIRIDGGTQMRADLNEDVVADYAQIVCDGGDFPPVVVFHDGSKHWLADGFHRHFAYQRAGAVEIPAEIRKGSKRDAILFSVGANASHGLRRTNADKRRSVETLLRDKEWAAWSDREIARTAKVSAPFVATVREALTVNSYSESRAYTTKHNTPAVMNTMNIGKAKPSEPTSTEAQPEPPAVAPDSAEAKAARQAEQAENDRWHAEQSAAVPEHIRQAEALRDAAIAKRLQAADAADDDLTDEQRVAELREHIKVVEAENATLRAENAKFAPMRVQFEQGGFEKVVAGKDEELRVAREQFALENADKVSWMGKANYWKTEAKRLGWKPDVVKIDTQTGAIKHA